MEVRGRNLTTGLPSTITITAPEIEEALKESVNIIVETTKKVLEETPPELSADIIKFTFSIPVAGKVTVFGTSEKFAGYTPYNDSLNQETVEIGTTEPDTTITSTLYIQLS